MLTTQDVVTAAAEYIGREPRWGRPMEANELCQLVAQRLGLLRKTEPDRTADELMYADSPGVHFGTARPLHPGETPPPGSWLFVVANRPPPAPAVDCPLCGFIDSKCGCFDGLKTLRTSHMGVALGTGQLVHASSKRKTVRFDDLWTGPEVFVRVARV